MIRGFITPNRFRVVVSVLAVAIVVLNAPSWLALLAGVAVALLLNQTLPVRLKAATPWILQAGVVALGASMNLAVVWQVGKEGALMTALSLTATLGAGFVLGRMLGVKRDPSLLIGVGTAICGGSAIAAVASVIKPQAEDVSMALAVVFVLNAVALVLFPPLGHMLHLPPDAFGRWAALAIHDTSSVVGAGLAYGPEALQVGTTTKLARALWIVPVTLGIALWRGREGNQGLSDVKWPWFILGFVATAALATWVPSFEIAVEPLVWMGRRLMVLALFFIGLSLSRDSLKRVGARPLWLGVILWALVGVGTLPWGAL